MLKLLIVSKQDLTRISTIFQINVYNTYATVKIIALNSFLASQFTDYKIEC